LNNGGKGWRICAQYIELDAGLQAELMT
jgi:hypothetical protein